MRKLCSLLIVALFITGCAVSAPQEALQLSPESLADRQIQTRRFDTANYQVMLSAAAATMQDLGFTLDESEYTLGVLVGSKRRDATSAGQVALSIFAAIFAGVTTPTDKEQVIRISMVMREITPNVSNQNSSSSTENNLEDLAKGSTKSEQPQNEDGQSTVRVTFQRVILNTAGQVTRAEQIKEVGMYKEFFEQLSKSVFLEAHEI